MLHNSEILNNIEKEFYSIFSESQLNTEWYQFYSSKYQAGVFSNFKL